MAFILFLAAIGFVFYRWEKHHSDLIVGLGRIEAEVANAARIAEEKQNADVIPAPHMPTRP